MSRAERVRKLKLQLLSQMLLRRLRGCGRWAGSDQEGEGTLVPRISTP